MIYGMSLDAQRRVAEEATEAKYGRFDSPVYNTVALAGSDQNNAKGSGLATIQPISAGAGILVPLRAVSHALSPRALRRPASRSRPAVVLVHGLMGYSFSWRHNLEIFAQHRQVYAVDLLGVGFSDHPSRVLRISASRLPPPDC